MRKFFSPLQPDEGFPAELMAEYLLERRTSQDLLDRYGQATKQLSLPSLSALERRSLRFADRSAFKLKLVESGLALHCPRGAFRQRLWVLAAVLEASTLHSADFLPRQHRFRELLREALLLLVFSFLGAILIALFRAGSGDDS